MQIIRKLALRIVIGMTLTFVLSCFVYADPAHDLYDKAWKKAWMENKVSEGLVMFKEILNKYPDSEWADDALWNVAYAYGAPLHDDAKRYSACEELLKKYPNSEWADDAMKSMVFIMYEKDWDDVLDLRKHPGKETTKEQKTSKTIKLAKEFLKRFPNSQFAPGVKFCIAKVYRYKLKEYDKAIKEAQEIISQHPSHRETPGKYIFIASTYWLDLRDLKSAERWYNGLLKKHPGHKKAKEARETLRSIQQERNK